MNNQIKRADQRLTRIAIVDETKCKPTKCNLECKTNCPVVKMGKLCVTVERNSKFSQISEVLCNGCGICVKKCPFNAIKIINLPKELDKDTTHRYHANSFKLHRLPQPRPGSVLGLVGCNGIGKSTALKILSGDIKPNLGNYENPPNWSQITQYFRGSSLQPYFNQMNEGKIKAVTKPQHVYAIPKLVEGTVGDLLRSHDSQNIADQVISRLNLDPILDRSLNLLSGGELQRFAIALTCVDQATMYIFDEPSSFLDIQQRLNAAKLIREISESPDKYVVVVEHDLSILEFMSDYVCLLYGDPGVYGVVTYPSGVLEGLNMFLEGFIQSENLRFRPESISFKTSIEDQQIHRSSTFSYPSFSHTQGSFSLQVESGSFSSSEILVLLGQNGTGKTTLIKLLAGKLDNLKISYKPQEINFKSQVTVSEIFLGKIPVAWGDVMFQSDVVKPMKIDNIMGQKLSELSGGELQRVALILCLGFPADLYLIDEPSAMLDAEQRLVVAKIIKRFILHNKKTAFVVEHDFIMATYLADRVIVYEGKPSEDCVARSPINLVEGMNMFLKKLDVTFRRDPKNYRPRVNKLNGNQDREQKKSGNYFLSEVATYW